MGDKKGTTNEKICDTMFLPGEKAPPLTQTENLCRQSIIRRQVFPSEKRTEKKALTMS